MRIQFLLVLIVLTLPAVGQNLASTESIGEYTAGCIRNSEALPKDGKGFQVIRLGRGRYFGHSETIDYITTLSEKANDALGATLLIADISQQTGGPILDDHSSHQIGLDADILFLQHPIAKKRSLTVAERQHIHPQSVLFPGGYGVDPNKWGTDQEKILKFAASDPRVDRIFINPVIKKKLCKTYAGQDWMYKLRPWYGHDGHFHVRLKCPEASTLCVPQQALGNYGDGCDELIPWFKDDGTIKSRKRSGSSAQRRLPEECMSIVYGNK